MTETHAALRALFAEAGFGFVDLPILYDAHVFVELLGEDLRRRLFLTTDRGGTELALRPDFTIPVALRHLAAGEARRRADYAYLGPVFRQREDEPDEFLQAGVESLGRRDRDAADADMLRLAFDAAARLGMHAPSVSIGDSALFAALLDHLDIDPSWRRRFARAFGDPVRLRAMIARAAEGGAAARRSRRRRALGAGERARIRREVEAIFAASGLGIAGRTPAEIAARHAEKAVLAAGIPPQAAKALSTFLGIAGPVHTVLPVLAAVGQGTGGLGKAVERFAARAEAFAERGIEVGRLGFAVDFGRRLDYYTGFVFEMRGSAGAAKPVIGGGRYDRLVSAIARLRHEAAVTVPAVGFSIWLDRAGKPA
jgi:ATP phosphoribosyltransferase regulatory subunit